MRKIRTKVNRRGLLAGVVGISGLFVLTSCVDDPEPTPEPAPDPTPTPNLDAPQEEKFEELTENDAYDEASLVYGDVESVNVVTVVLDFASPESADFFNTNSGTMREFYVESDRKLEIVLISPPDADGIPVLDSYSANTTSMGILVYLKDKERFWEYAERMFNREEKSISEEELFKIGEEFGILPDNARMEMSATRMLVDRMTFDAEIYTGGFDSPHLVLNSELWTGDMNNPDEVSGVFASAGE